MTERARDVDTIPWLHDISQDLRYAFRILRRNPAFTAIAVLTLALGIGASAAVFSIVNGILLRPLPFRDPSRLVAVLDGRPAQGVDWVFDSPRRFEEWVRRNTVFDELAAAQNCYYRLDDGGVPRLLQGGCVSANFFPMLGVQPVLGRLFTLDEDRTGARVAVLSYASWRAFFGSDAAALGKTIRRTANDAEFTIIGVLPASFKFASDDFALWAPLKSDPNYRNQDDRTLLVFARLKQGVTLPQAESVMDGVGRQLAEEFPTTSAGWTVKLWPLQAFYANVRNIRLTLWVLFAAVGVLMLIACANLANLLLARASARSTEISLRRALGATRGRVMRQLITESVLLGLVGGAAGFLLARIAFPTLLAIMPYIPSFQPNAIRLDSQVLGFSMAFALVASIAFGLVPASRASRQDLNQHLREAGRGAFGSRRGSLMRTIVVTSQITLVVVLVTSAALFAQSFRNLITGQLGFNPSHILTVRLCCLDEAHYTTERDVSAYYSMLFERLRSVPGVESVSGASDLPLRYFQGAGVPFQVRGQAAVDEREERTADFFYVEPHYFDTLHIPIVRGRAITDLDTADTLHVALINESLARRVWPGQDPIGQELHMAADPGGRWYRVVGVVADTRDRGLGLDPQAAVYASYYQSIGRYTFLLIRTRPDPMTVAPQVRKAIVSVSDRLPIDRLGTLEQQMADSVSAQRFSTVLVGLFAGLALSLGTVGVYGVTSYTVSQRTQEIGIRMALGASRVTVLAMFLREGMTLAAVGIAAGALAAWKLTRFLQSLLYGIRASDPRILASVIGCLTLVTLAACLVPALRATRVDPATTLR
ncbi:MAG TPA: ABC transporter permease [Vicinamibacterales bacterium]|nr:ABC transporter permease [Vicinamibacterales bacterium]